MDQLDHHPFKPAPVPRWFAALTFLVSLGWFLGDGVVRLATFWAMAGMGYLGGWLAQRGETDE